MDTAVSDPPATLSAGGVARAYLNRRAAVLILLGFASGLPYELTAGTLAAWLTDAGFDMTRIGLFALVGFPYTLKFLWSPLIDRYAIPILGRRRGWLLLTQLLLAVAILAMAQQPGRLVLPLLAAAATVVALTSATQDIVIDAYRTDVLPPAERGPGSAVFVTGYRIAMITSGAGALILAGKFHWTWPAVYRLVAAGMIVGILATLFAPEPASQAAPRTLHDAVVEPIGEFLRRRRGWLVLLFVFLFKLPEYMAASMTMPFLLKAAHFSKTDVGAVRQGLGVAITIFGAFVGGGIVTRVGLWRSLWVFGLLHSVSNLAFLGLSWAGPNYAAMVATIGVENFCVGLTTAGFAAYLMSQCNPKFSATQFAVMSGLMALCRTLCAPPSGWIADALGWHAFFVLSALAGIPGVMLLPWLRDGEER